MGSDQLVGVMTTIGRDGAAKAGKPFDEKKAEMVGSMFKTRVDAESEAYYITSQVRRNSEDVTLIISSVWMMVLLTLEILARF